MLWKTPARQVPPHPRLPSPERVARETAVQDGALAGLCQAVVRRRHALVHRPAQRVFTR